MRILYVADGRSPTAIHWMQHFVEAGHEVHLATTFNAKPNLKLASLSEVPVAFSSAAGRGVAGQRRGLRRSVPLGLRTGIRQWLGPFTLGRAARPLTELAQNLKPDLVHALRIPFEGMLAATADLGAPLLISVWGNDFTLHAPASPFMGRATRRAMRRTDALHTDTERDQELAKHWGFDLAKPSTALPGNGGIRLDVFYPLPGAAIPDDVHARVQVINPRGIRTYIRNDIFFRAIPLVLRKRPEVRFLCPSMEGEPEAEKWVADLDLGGYVQLMPQLSPRAMADTYHACQVMVSPAFHDGTPNSLLEAMACACFPVAGDIQSIREWITDGENGLLVDPTDPQALADAIIRALKDADLRAQAADFNVKLIQERAEYGKVVAEAEAFYERVAS